MNVAVIGYGSVGKALTAHIRSKNYHVDVIDPDLYEFPESCVKQVLHFTIPYLSDAQYLDAYTKWVAQCPSEYIIIHSTINPLLLPKLAANTNACVLYAPIRNREQDMHCEMATMPLFIAYITEKNESPCFIAYLHLCFDVIWFHDALALAYGKLLETTWFGMNIAFCQMAKLICDEHHFDFEEAYTKYTHYSRIGHNYSQTPLHYIPRPVFVPHEIGGKCVMPNMENILHPTGLMNHLLYEFINTMNYHISVNKRML